MFLKNIVPLARLLKKFFIALIIQPPKPENYKIILVSYVIITVLILTFAVLVVIASFNLKDPVFSTLGILFSTISLAYIYKIWNYFQICMSK